MEAAENALARLRADGIRAKIDARPHMSPGAKYFEWERKGVPLRIEIGPRDLQRDQLAVARRGVAEGDPRREFGATEEVLASMPGRLEAFQADLLEMARARREEASVRGVRSVDEIAEALDSGAGFVYTGWSGDPAVEAEVKERTKASIRVLADPPFRSGDSPSTCVSGQGTSVAEVAWARAY